MRSCIILLFQFLVAGHATTVDIQMKTANGTVGESITLVHKLSGDYWYIFWSLSNMVIFKCQGRCENSLPRGNQFKGRSHLNQIGDLTISDLHINDTGEFQLQTEINGTIYILHFPLMVYGRATTVEAPVETANGTVGGNTTLEHQLPGNHQDDSWCIYFWVAFGVIFRVIPIIVPILMKKMKHKKDTFRTLFKRATNFCRGGGEEGQIAVMLRGEQENISLDEEENQDMLPLERVKKREESTMIDIEPQWEANAQISVLDSE